MKKQFISTAVLFFLLYCYTRKVPRRNQVFVGNNEDFSDPVTLVWILPPEKGKYWKKRGDRRQRTTQRATKHTTST